MVKHLVIIDGHHLMYRAFYAIPRGMQTASGEQTNAVFGVASMLLQILKTEQPDSLLFCFDADEKTFRHEEYAAYKDGRAETPDEFYAQIPRIFALVETFGLRAVSGQKFEADDFACSYARLAERAGERVTIISGDRDLFQLASDRIRIAIPHKAYQSPEYLGPAEITTKYGVTPEQIPSYKGLVGDPSDNLKGVTGIGPVAASSLLQQYGTLESLYDHLPDIKPAWRSKLEPQREQAFFCKRMAELICDIPLTLTLDDLHIRSFEVQAIHALFTALQFGMLRKRFDAFMASEAGQKYRMQGAPVIAAASVQFEEEVDEAPQLSLL